MALVTMKEILENARKKNIGVGAFNVGSMEMVKGVIQAAEELKAPIILQVAEPRMKHAPLALMGPMVVYAAKKAGVDIAVHLDHGLTLETIEEALEIGFTSVMFDGSLHPLEKNIELTKKVADMAKKYGATAEGELGHVGGSEDGSKDHGVKFTSPEEAKIFCEKTGIDALAVAIGNAHGFYKATPELAFDVLKEIRETVDLPLVLHGGTGISDDDFKKAIKTGITKVNIATSNFNSVVKGMEKCIGSGEKYDFFKINEAIVESVCENTKHHIKIFS